MTLSFSDSLCDGPVAAPTILNSLPANVHSCLTLSAFSRHLKSHLFSPASPLPSDPSHRLWFFSTMVLHKFIYLLTLVASCISRCVRLCTMKDCSVLCRKTMITSRMTWNKCDILRGSYASLSNVCNFTLLVLLFRNIPVYWVICRDGLKAVLSRQRSRQRGRGKAAMSLTEARQRQRARGRGEAD